MCTPNFQLVSFRDYQTFRLCIFLCFYFFTFNFFVFRFIPLIGVFLRREKFFFWVRVWVYHPHWGAFFNALFCYFFNIFTFWRWNSFSLFLSFVLLFFFLCFLFYLIYCYSYFFSYSLWVVQGGYLLVIGPGSFIFQFRPDFFLAIFIPII